MPTDTNIYPIKGLAGLSVAYRVYRIVGLLPDTPGYFNNLQTLIDRLSRILKEPVTTISRDGVSHIVIPEDSEEPPIVPLTGTAATLQATGELVEIAFDRRDPELDPVRQRFLQFSIQAPMRDRNELWQPRSGQAFFAKVPERSLEQVELYRGASLRVVSTACGSWGVCVDLKTKLIRKKPLGENLDPGEARRFKGRSCIYQFGHRWFEVTLDGIADFDISTALIPEDGSVLSINEYVMRHSRKPVPDRLAKLNQSGAAIFYRTEGPVPKHAPAALCFLVEDAHTKIGARNHRQAILPPHIRKKRATVFVKKYLARFSLRNVELTVSDIPIENSNKRFAVPAFEFGNSRTVGFGQTTGADSQRRLSELGPARQALISDPNAGFFSTTPLGRQYIVLPQSVVDSSGPKFVDALKQTVNELYRAGGAYDPILIAYDDIGPKRNFIDQGKAIKTAMQSQTLVAGHALVMIQDVVKKTRDTDPLEAMIVKDFPTDFNLNASVIHTSTIQRSYQYSGKRGEPEYFVSKSNKGRVSSYLRNVALSKILLTNGKVPFVLAGRTCSDLIIGIDVKQNTAAFSLIADGGRIVHSKTWNSRKRERLTEEQVALYLSELVLIEKESFDLPPSNIVVHRDGRVFESEIAGLERACEELAEAGVLASNWSLTVLEIKKTGPVTVRFFDTVYSKEGARTENPMIGSWLQLSDEEGFVTTTGMPFRRPGTTQPLHVIKKHGTMSLEECLREVFELSCLSWSSPDNGIRVPITIKLCDRVLFEDAADYDEDAFAHASTTKSEVRS